MFKEKFKEVKHECTSDRDSNYSYEYKPLEDITVEEFYKNFLSEFVESRNSGIIYIHNKYMFDLLDSFSSAYEKSKYGIKYYFDKKFITQVSYENLIPLYCKGTNIVVEDVTPLNLPEYIRNSKVVSFEKEVYGYTDKIDFSLTIDNREFLLTLAKAEKLKRIHELKEEINNKMEELKHLGEKVCIKYKNNI